LAVSYKREIPESQCAGPYCVPRGVAFSYARSTPAVYIRSRANWHMRQSCLMCQFARERILDQNLVLAFRENFLKPLRCSFSALFGGSPFRCRVNLEQTGQSRSDSDFVLSHCQLKSLLTHSSYSFPAQKRSWRAFDQEESPVALRIQEEQRPIFPSP